MENDGRDKFSDYGLSVGKREKPKTHKPEQWRTKSRKGTKRISDRNNNCFQKVGDLDEMTRLQQFNLSVIEQCTKKRVKKAYKNKESAISFPREPAVKLTSAGKSKVRKRWVVCCDSKSKYHYGIASDASIWGGGVTVVPR